MTKPPRTRNSTRGLRYIWGCQPGVLVVLVGKLVNNLGGLQSKLIRFRSLG